MTGPSSVCVEVFKARRNGGFELTVVPPSALECVEDALRGFYDEESAIMGDIRVEGLNEDQLYSALGGIASIGRTYEAVAPTTPVDTMAAPLSQV